MKQTYHIPVNPHLGQVSLDVHDDILRLLKHRNPNANLFEEDPEIESLYYALILIRSGHLRLSEEEEEGSGNYILLEVR